MRLTCRVVGDAQSTLRLIGYLADITNQKEYEIELNEAKERAESANIAKSMFLANMSHEIRTPMNAVVNFADFMLNTNLDSTQLDYIQKIQKSGTLMLNTLNDILDFSKIEANKLSLELRPYNTHEEFQTIINLVDQWAEKKDICFISSLEDGLPEYLVSDGLRVRQILINLLNNAIKFTQHPGAVTFTVRHLKTIDDIIWLNFHISDTGIGMTKEQVNKIFTAFTQADLSITRRFGGTGLGLTISKMLVDLLKGTISLESTVDVGTTFSVQIPFRSATMEEIALAQAEVKNSYEDYKFPKLRCLVAEDHLINQQIISILLSSLGITVHITNNGQEALDTFLESDDFDCIILDIQMPVMDGYTATQKIREIDTDKAKNIPIFALTAHAIRGDSTKSLSYGMNYHFTKPLKKLEICQVFEGFFPKHLEIKEKKS